MPDGTEQNLNSPEPESSKTGSELQPTPAPLAPTEVSGPLPQPETVPSNHKSLLGKALAAIQLRKQKKFEKIMALAATKPFVTNDQVEKLLRVSDATATRYLAALVAQGRLKRTGHPRHARYEPV